MKDKELREMLSMFTSSGDFLQPNLSISAPGFSATDSPAPLLILRPVEFFRILSLLFRYVEKEIDEFLLELNFDKVLLIKKLTLIKIESDFGKLIVNYI